MFERLCGKIRSSVNYKRYIGEKTKRKGGNVVYIVNERNLKGVSEEEVQNRMAIVEYLREWSEGVYKEATTKASISLAGRYIRARVLERENELASLMNEVVLVDLGDFWSAVDGVEGVVDDVNLYGIFCIIFGEISEVIGEEANKLEGNIGYAPKLRLDISERRNKDVNGNGKSKKKFSLFGGKKKKNKGEEEEQEESKEDIEEDEVEINDKLVTPDNVNKLTIVAVGLISIFIILLVFVILF